MSDMVSPHCAFCCGVNGAISMVVGNASSEGALVGAVILLAPFSFQIIHPCGAPLHVLPPHDIAGRLGARDAFGPQNAGGLITMYTRGDLLPPVLVRAKAFA